MKNHGKSMKKSTRNRSSRRLVPWGLLRASWCLWGRLESFVGASWGRLGGLLGRLGAKKVANMVPTWFPKRNPNRSKIEAKIDQFLNASWKFILKGFHWILEAKENHVESKWHPKSIPTSNNDFLKKQCFSFGKTMILKVLGIEVGKQNPSNID